MTGLLAGIGKQAIARFILQRMVKHPAMRLAQEVGDFESAHLTGEPRLDTADHIQSRVLGCLGAFASIFYNETNLFKSPAVNGPGGKRFASYEDYDSEFA
ncbi:hypothetical protein GJ496_001959 [Pomphorhynchus laevis]|nr:hypothetical protein GJ496_001959 [Pomphorhynchus laevis]